MSAVAVGQVWKDTDRWVEKGRTVRRRLVITAVTDLFVFCLAKTGRRERRLKLRRDHLVSSGRYELERPA